MRLWDAAFALLVLFPLATGGAWWRGAHFRVEYTQASFAGLFLFAVAFYRWRWRGRDIWREGYFLPKMKAAAHRWRELLREKGVGALWPAWLGVSALWFGAAWSRHEGFHSSAADMGIFTNALWNVAYYGTPYSSIKGGISLLADHQIFLLYPLGWLFRLFPFPPFLLLLQAGGLSASGIALFLLARQRVGRVTYLVALLPLALWAYAPLRAANLFDFHPEVFQLPLFLFAIWGLQEAKDRPRLGGALLLGAALAAKESAGPVACGIGLAWALGAGPAPTRPFTRRLGIATIGIGLAAFLFDTKLFPSWHHFSYVYAEAYAPFDTSLTGLLLTPFTHPLELAHRLFAFSRWKFLFATLGPFLFLPLLGRQALWAAVPGYALLFLTAGDQRLSLGYHYAIEPAVGILFALSASLTHPWVQKHARTLTYGVALAGFAFYGRSEIFHWRYYSLNSHQAWVKRDALPALRPSFALAANASIVPHVATRHWVHFMPTLQDSLNQAYADAVIWDAGFDEAPLTPSDRVLMMKTLSSQYRLENQCGTWNLYCKRELSSCLDRPLPCPEKI